MQEYVMTFFKCMVAAAPFVFAGLTIGVVILAARSIVRVIRSVKRTRQICEAFETYEVAKGESQRG